VATFAGEEMGACCDDAKQQVEEILNEIAADQAVFRITLQSFLARVFAARPDRAAQGLADLKHQVIRSIDGMPPSKADVEGGERWKRLATIRAEQLFVEIEDALKAPPRPTRSTTTQ
jgi:hypothetical protein